MTLNISTEKQDQPSEQMLEEKLSTSYPAWKSIKEFFFASFPKPLEEWKYGGEKYGWSCRLLSKNRRIVYLIPEQDQFKVAFVLGERARQASLLSNIPEELKTLINSAKTYAEGTGIRFVVKDEHMLNSVKALMEIKAVN